jgi:hypothetical protein
MLQPASFSQDDIDADDAIRPDNRFGTQLCFWIDDCSWVNLHVAHFKQGGGT